MVTDFFSTPLALFGLAFFFAQALKDWAELRIALPDIFVGIVGAYFLGGGRWILSQPLFPDLYFLALYSIVVFILFFAHSSFGDIFLIFSALFFVGSFLSWLTLTVLAGLFHTLLAFLKDKKIGFFAEVPFAPSLFLSFLVCVLLGEWVK